MLSRAEFIEFIDDIVQFISKRMEYDCELSLLLLHVHEEAEEGWDQVILAPLKQHIVHFTISLDAGLLSDFGWVHIVFLLVGLLQIFIIVLSWHAAIFTNSEFLAGTLG